MRAMTKEEYDTWRTQRLEKICGKRQWHSHSESSTEATACSRRISDGTLLALIEAEVTCKQCLRAIPRHKKIREMKNAENTRLKEIESRREMKLISSISNGPHALHQKLSFFG